jgi:hypothetical protein
MEGLPGPGPRAIEPDRQVRLPRDFGESINQKKAELRSQELQEFRRGRALFVFCGAIIQAKNLGREFRDSEAAESIWGALII